MGEKAGNAAGNALASKVPFGGLMKGAAKKKGKAIGAATAIGGMPFIKKTTERSLNKVDDYIVYLQVVHSENPEFQKGMASAMALHPEMEGRTDIAMKNAYKKAAKAETESKAGKTKDGKTTDGTGKSQESGDKKGSESTGKKPKKS